MNRVVVTSRLDELGGLHLSLGPADANREVQVTIESLPPPAMTQEEWRKFIFSMAGSITDPTFCRHEQGDYEQREIVR